MDKEMFITQDSNCRNGINKMISFDDRDFKEKAEKLIALVEDKSKKANSDIATEMSELCRIQDTLSRLCRLLRC